jgi:hypothetical protein
MENLNLIFICFILLIYYFIFLFENHFLNLIDIYNNSISLDSLNLSTAGLSTHLTRDKNGRFISNPRVAPLEPLADKLKEAIVGEILGDGHLRFTKKGPDGLPKGNSNAHFAMTARSA